MENFFLSDNVKHSVFNIQKVIIFILIIFVVGFLFFLNAPVDFPVGTTFKINPGQGLRSVSLKLKTEHIIRSRIMFEAFVIIFGGEKSVISTNYFFESKLSVYEVARRISKGEHFVAPVVITIPEGSSAIQIADISFSKLPNFDKNKFLEEVKLMEGSLFPDTYYFLATDGEKEVIKSMKENFDKKISSLRPEIALSGKTEKDIMLMASIVEKEAKGDADREFISGILWKRLGMGMPLQVDAMPETYNTKGLPKNPTAYPGLKAIYAAIHPQTSPYLYYLHDKDGNIHFAKTFAEHNANIRKYLR